MNRQQILTNGVIGVARQGRKSMGSMGCQYRLGTLKCALGFSIPDEQYHEGLEDASFQPNTRLGDILGVETDDDAHFLCAFQAAHDEADTSNFTADFLDRAESVANTYGLEMPNVLA